MESSDKVLPNRKPVQPVEYSKGGNSVQPSKDEQKGNNMPKVDKKQM